MQARARALATARAKTGAGSVQSEGLAGVPPAARNGPREGGKMEQREPFFTARPWEGGSPSSRIGRVAAVPPKDSQCRPHQGERDLSTKPYLLNPIPVTRGGARAM